MEINEIVMLDVTTPQEHYILIKQHDEWVLEGDSTAALDQEVIALFVSRVVDLPVEISYPARSTTSIQHGLDSPTVIIQGRNRQGKNVGKLVLGKREKGLVYARGAGHQGLSQVRSNILSQIPTQTQLIR